MIHSWVIDQGEALYPRHDGKLADLIQQRSITLKDLDLRLPILDGELEFFAGWPMPATHKSYDPSHGDFHQKDILVADHVVGGDDGKWPVMQPLQKSTKSSEYIIFAQHGPGRESSLLATSVWQVWKLVFTIATTWCTNNSILPVVRLSRIS